MSSFPSAPRLLLAGLATLAVAGAGACTRKQAAAATTVETVTASRQAVVVDVEATGQITPINAVEVRSKASGQIVQLPVATGSRVKPGDLLARIDPRDPQSRYDQAAAQVRAARAQAEITKTQYDRNLALVRQGVITAPELESARLAYANAQSSLTGARTQQDLARIALEDVTIRAPSAGTVIARSVAPGQVIASSVNSPSGGTVLLTLADLGTVYDSTLVNESDVGKVRAGQDVRVTVDAYPGRTFRGTVEKVEPRATVQQSVTFFPVLVRLANEDGALMPGMNTDVSILVDRRDEAVTVPLDALRSTREAAGAATALGLDAQQVRTALQNARESARENARENARGARSAGADTPRNVAVAGGDSAARRGRRGRGGRGARGGDSSGAAGVGASGAGGAGAVVGSGGYAPGSRAVVFVKQGEVFSPRVVTLGLTNYDVAEITAGLREGETVALVSGAVLQQQRGEFQDRIRSRSGVPGIGGGGGGGGPGGGGGGRGGGGGGSGGGRPGG